MADLARLFNFTTGQPIRESEVDAEFDQLIARINDLPPEAFQTAVAEALGLSQPGTVRRGKSIVATEESRTNAAYGLLATPDQVSVAVPTDGLIEVKFQALWKESVAQAARAAIFLGANQLKRASLTAPAVQEATMVPTAEVSKYTALSSSAGGLASPSSNATEAGPAVTTGQVVAISKDDGGACYIFGLPAGTYTVSVQYKALTGTVTVKERRLWVEARGY